MKYDYASKVQFNNIVINLTISGNSDIQIGHMINLNILMSDPKWKANYYPQLPEFKKEAIRKIEAYNKYFDQLAQDTGVFMNQSIIKGRLKSLYHINDIL